MVYCTTCCGAISSNSFIGTLLMLFWCIGNPPTSAISRKLLVNDDGVIKWKHFKHCWLFVRVIHPSLVVSLTRANDAELWCFLWSAIEKKIETPVIETPSCSLWRHCNDISVMTLLSKLHGRRGASIYLMKKVSLVYMNQFIINDINVSDSGTSSVFCNMWYEKVFMLPAQARPLTAVWM